MEEELYAVAGWLPGNFNVPKRSRTYWNRPLLPIYQLSAAVISIRRYMQGAQKEDKTDLLEFVLLLLEAIQRFAIEGAPGESAILREIVQQVVTAAENHAPLAELLAMGTNAMEALKQHNL